MQPNSANSCFQAAAAAHAASKTVACCLRRWRRTHAHMSQFALGGSVCWAVVEEEEGREERGDGVVGRCR